MVSEAIPVAAMVESIVGCKWSVRLLQLIADGHRRPSALLRACPGLSPKVMNERLRKMTRFGIARRTVFGEKPPVEVEYALTPFGRRFMAILGEVRRLQEAVDRGAIDGPDLWHNPADEADAAPPDRRCRGGAARGGRQRARRLDAPGSERHHHSR
jgi:DNA-binding HxlR family transcriptional regulator